MQAPSCCQRVAQLCDEAEQRLRDDNARAAVTAARERLREPIRVAVAGRVKSGKSTLVNALLHHEVAPTAYGECTRAVTWFRCGYPPEARLVLRSGGSRRLLLEPGQRLPRELGADPDELDRIEVQLSSNALTGMTVIDTPGLESAYEELSVATRRALGDGRLSRRTQGAARHADALVYVLTGPARHDEIEVLRAFRGHLGGIHASAVNTIAVLNKADLMGEDDEDALTQAERQAARYAEELSGLAAAVIPTVGVVAETVEAGLLTESDLAALRALAALPAGERELLLDNVAYFTDAPAPVGAAERRRLLERLGLYAVRRAVEWAKAGGASVAALRAMLAELSGLQRLRALLDEVFGRRADVLKAADALAELERLTLPGSALERADADWLAQGVERARLDPAMQVLATTWAYAHVASGAVRLPDELEADLRRVVLGATVDEMLGLAADAGADALRAAAAERSARWRAFEFSGDSEQRRVASIMTLQYAALWQLVEAPT
jgi:hypothetical protein